MPNSPPIRGVNAYLHWNELSETSTRVYVCNAVRRPVYQEGNAASTCTDHRWWGDSSISATTLQPRGNLWTWLYLCMLYVFCPLPMVLRRYRLPTLIYGAPRNSRYGGNMWENSNLTKSLKNTDVFWSGHRFRISVSHKLAVRKCWKSITLLYVMYGACCLSQWDMIDRPRQRCACWLHLDAQTKTPFYYHSSIGTDRLLDSWFLGRGLLFQNTK